MQLLQIRRVCFTKIPILGFAVNTHIFFLLLLLSSTFLRCGLTIANAFGPRRSLNISSNWDYRVHHHAQLFIMSSIAPCMFNFAAKLCQEKFGHKLTLAKRKELLS